MQEINEGNVYDVLDTFGAGTKASVFGIKKVKTKIKKQLADTMKRNKMKKRTTKKTFDELLEDVSVVDIGGIVVGDTELYGGVGSFLSPNNKTGAGVVVVTNPKGDSSKAPGFGMGFGLNPSLVPNVQQFIQNYSDLSGNKESDKFEVQKELEKMKSGENPGEAISMTWQQINRAVSNYVTQNLNQTMKDYHVALPDGMSPVNPVSTPMDVQNFGYDPHSRQIFRIKGFRGEKK